MMTGESDEKYLRNAFKKSASSLFSEIFDGKPKDAKSLWLQLSLLITNDREAASVALEIVTTRRLKKLKAETASPDVDIGVHASDILYALQQECLRKHNRELDMHVVAKKAEPRKVSAQQRDTYDSDGCNSITRGMADRQFVTIETGKKEAPAAWLMLHEMVCESTEESARDVLVIMTAARVMLLRQSSVPSQLGEHRIGYFERGYATNILQELQTACLAVHRMRLEDYVVMKAPIGANVDALKARNPSKILPFGKQPCV